MSATPAFASTPKASGATASATLDTSLTAPTHTATIFTAGSSGSKVDEIDFLGLGTTAAGVINVFRARSGTYFLIDQILVTVVTSSTTAIAFKSTRTYENLLLQSGDTIEFTVTVSGLQSLIEGSAFGGDF
jgi:hypothetical protein